MTDERRFRCATAVLVTVARGRAITADTDVTVTVTAGARANVSGGATTVVAREAFAVRRRGRGRASQTTAGTAATPMVHYRRTVKRAMRRRGIKNAEKKKRTNGIADYGDEN